MNIPTKSKKDVDVYVSAKYKEKDSYGHYKLFVDKQLKLSM